MKHAPFDLIWPVYQNLLVICHLLVLLIFIAPFCSFYNGFIFSFSFHEQTLSKSKTFFNECRHNINALFYSFYNYLFWKLTKHLSVGKNAILRHLRFLQSKNYFTLLSLHLLLIFFVKTSYYMNFRCLSWLIS